MAGVWKRDGTVTVTTSSKKVVGVGTTFADPKNGVAKGHIFTQISGSAIDLYEVDYVVSNTELYLVQAFRGDTASGVTYAIITTFSDSIPEFSRKLTAILASYQEQSDVLQQLYTSDAAEITVTAPDGTQRKLIPWKEVVSGSRAAVTGHEKKTDAHEIGGIKGLADALKGKAPSGYGIGEAVRNATAQEQTLGGIFRDSSISYGGICIPYDGSPAQMFVGVVIGENKLRFGVRTGNTSTPIRFFDALSTNTTTVDSNGFIKRASPVARLYGNDYLARCDSEYQASGCVATNDEAQGVFAARDTTGVYRITGSRGFATDGWYIETPADANGNKLLFVEYEQCLNGDILIKTFSPDYSTGCCMAGEPKDIPEGRWIDLRLAMPIAE